MSTSARVEERTYPDNDSQEGILPGKNEIWMTRETTVQRDGDSMHRSEFV